MVQRSHQVRLTQAAFADHDYRATLIGADGLDALQKVMGRIRDFQKLLRGNLCCTGVGVVGELNGCPFEAFAPKFIPQSQSKHFFPIIRMTIDRIILITIDIANHSIDYCLIQ